MSDKGNKKQIAVAKGGPYLVSLAIPLSLQTITPNEQGGSWDWTEGRSFEVTEQYALCRCGHSKNKPFCDGTHKQVKFDGTETASHARYDRQADVLHGQTLILKDDQKLCAFARFCDNHGSIWEQIHKTDNANTRDEVVHEATYCPSGRLVVHDKASGAAIEPTLPQSIGVVEDPTEACSGPLWVRGGIPVISQSGEPYEVRNRVTLCRCGQSSNKPFCDGSHASVKFNDGLT
jgi:CDGSH-type Zn-finger protein